MLSHCVVRIYVTYSRERKECTWRIARDADIAPQFLSNLLVNLQSNFSIALLYCFSKYVETYMMIGAEMDMLSMEKDLHPLFKD